MPFLSILTWVKCGRRDFISTLPILSAVIFGGEIFVRDCSNTEPGNLDLKSVCKFGGFEGVDLRRRNSAPESDLQYKLLKASSMSKMLSLQL